MEKYYIKLSPKQNFLELIDIQTDGASGFGLLYRRKYLSHLAMTSTMRDNAETVIMEMRYTMGTCI